MARLVVNNQQLDVPREALCGSLLAYLRDELGLTGTKEGCASGDCGACTVVAVGPADGTVRTLNSCITPVGAVAGGCVLTVDGVGGETLHPVQQAMADMHGAQCGFCTPGFVMARVGERLARRAAGDMAVLDRDTAVAAVSGNLCRCTGYRPILAAAQSAGPVEDDPPFDWLFDAPEADSDAVAPYAIPRTLDALLACCRDAAASGDAVLLAAGTTDAWLTVTQAYQDYARIVDLTNVAELKALYVEGDRLTIGAAVTHAELLSFFAAPDHRCDAIVEILERFGSPQIRARGTVGGNIANASPIADWAPLLLALDAELQLTSFEGTVRTVPLAGFYQGYKQTELAADELLTSLSVPMPDQWASLAAGKISKRTEDDISSVMGAALLETEGHDRRVTVARVAFGGVAATPVRLTAIEDALLGTSLATLSDARIDELASQAGAGVNPISDVRASASYRRAMTGALLKKALLKLRDGSAPGLWEAVSA